MDEFPKSGGLKGKMIAVPRPEKGEVYRLPRGIVRCDSVKFTWFGWTCRFVFIDEEGADIWAAGLWGANVQKATVITADSDAPIFIEI